MPEIRTCTRLLQWDAAHRVEGHIGKCRSLHGHRYVAEITCSAAALDDMGTVIDFGAIKERVGWWIDAHWDHTVIYDASDELMLRASKVFEFKGLPSWYALGGPPTAENIAQELHRIADSLLPHEIEVARVRVWETPNCYADFEVTR